VVRAQYKVGSTDLRFVTQRQLSLNAAESALIRVQADQRIQRVNLHLALGGSFEPAPQSGPIVVTGGQERPPR
jgi:outer membrane protein TolC